MKLDNLLDVVDYIEVFNARLFGSGNHRRLSWPPAAGCPARRCRTHTPSSKSPSRTSPSTVRSNGR
jgi:hypothetical protein